MQIDYASIGQEVARRIFASSNAPSWNDLIACLQDIHPEEADFIKTLKILGTDEQASKLMAARTVSQYLIIKSSIITQSRNILSENAASMAESFLVGLSDFLSFDQPVIGGKSAPEKVSPLKIDNHQPPGFPKVPISKPIDAAEPATIYDDGQSTRQPREPRQTEQPRSKQSSSFKKPAIIATVAVLALALPIVVVPPLLNNLGSGTSEVNSSDSFDDIISRGHINLGAQSDSPPLNYVDQGQRTGLDYQMLKLLASEREFSLTGNGAVQGDVNTDDYSDIPNLLKNNDNRGNYVVDVIAGGLTYKDGDIPDVKFTIPYIDGFGYSLLTAANSPIKSLSQLKGKKVGVVKGDPDVLAYVKSELPDSEIEELSDASETWLFDNLDPGKVDAIVYDFPFASVETRNTPIKILISNMPNSSVEYRFGVRSKDDKLLEKLNSAIRKLKERQEYGELLRKFLPTDNIVKPSATGKKTYTVRAGDTLSSIAQRHLGSADKWAVLQSLNNLPNPSFIVPGQIIIVPSEFN